MTKDLATFILMVASVIMAFVGLTTTKSKSMIPVWIFLLIFNFVVAITYFLTKFY